MSHAIASAFDATLHALHADGASLTHDDLRRLYPSPSLSSKSSSTSSSPAVPPLEQVQFYADFACDPAAANAFYQRERDDATRTHGAEYVQQILRANRHHKWRKQRQFDFRLTPDETARLQQHGVMATERLGAESFADVYYRLYTDDLPVLVTSDSILHAWHRSFDAFLTDFEMDELLPLLGATLSTTLVACATEYDAAVAAENVALQTALAEVELYVATAHRLLLRDETDAAAAAAAAAAPAPADEHPYYHQERLRELAAEEAYEAKLGRATPLRVVTNANRLTTILETVYRARSATVTILGSDRELDGSLFTPRGHYTKTKKLERFFRAMTWLGTVDFRVAGTDDAVSDRFQLQCACVVVHVLRVANTLEAFAQIHETIATLAGDGVGIDSMTPPQLGALLRRHGDSRDVLASCFASTDTDASSASFLLDLQDEIANRGLGTQAITAHLFVASLDGPSSRPPTAFALLGQPFVWSAFVFSKLVFDQVVTGDQKKVPRRMVSGVDAAFALFGNDAAAVDVLATRMAATPATASVDVVKFRDGLPYTANLLAARRIVDDALATSKVDPTTSSVALLWQLALRELSTPLPPTASTAVFSSDAWAKRQMNTQLASFAQLRHDTVLYAKQGATYSTCCEYPAGYVDPYPSFWRRMQELATRTLAIVDQLALVQQLTNDSETENKNKKESYGMRKARSCFQRFIDVTQTLFEISTAQAAKQALSDDQVSFLKRVMEERHGSGASRFLGWYPSLFYTKPEDSATRDVLVADVHTDTPSVEHGDAGGVLHVGVGDVNLAMVVVDDTLYAGPVFSYYECITPIDTRLTDAQFRETLPTRTAPQWAQNSFLVTK